MAVRFEKWEGLGNDFVVVSPEAAEGLDARAVCDRHRGIGADGVLIVSPPGTGPARMRVINADGSEPEMCGNGLRCAALSLVAAGLAPAGRPFPVLTGAGLHTCEVVDGAAGLVRVTMRPPALAPAEVPTTLPAEQGVVLDRAIHLGARALAVSCVSMGNPHAVTFDPLDGSERAELGPLLEAATDLFPARVNAGFARLTGPRAIELFVHERGAGWTEACGTGACAAAVAAVATGRIAPGGPIAVTLPGGTLTIEVPAPGQPVRMTGPARRVFVGELG